MIWFRSSWSCLNYEFYWYSKLTRKWGNLYFLIDLFCWIFPLSCLKNLSKAKQPALTWILPIWYYTAWDTTGISRLIWIPESWRNYVQKSIIFFLNYRMNHLPLKLLKLFHLLSISTAIIKIVPGRAQTLIIHTRPNSRALLEADLLLLNLQGIDYNADLS